MACQLVSPAILNLQGEYGIYRNSSYCLELQFRDDIGVIDLTGYVLDADIQDPTTQTTVATWTVVATTPLDGIAEMEFTPAETLEIPAGNYIYDLSLTDPSGERYYWLKGAVTVYETVSRT